MSEEKLQPLLDEVHKLGYTIDQLKWSGAPEADAQALCVILARLVSSMMNRVRYVNEFHEKNRENLAYLEYISAMNYAIFTELGFTDKDLEEFAKESRDPQDVAVQRIRDLKATKTTTVH